MIAPNLAAGARLAAKNESQALDEKTARTYELRLITLEDFAKKNRDDAMLFGSTKRPFFAATLQTFMHKCSQYFSKVFETILAFCVLSVGCGFLVIEPSYLTSCNASIYCV